VLSRILEKLEIIPLHRGRSRPVSNAAVSLNGLQEEKIIGIFPSGRSCWLGNYQSIMPQAGVASIVNSVSSCNSTFLLAKQPYTNNFVKITSISEHPYCFESKS